MHHIQRRLSPSLIVAVAALFVALAGTAIADGVIITSPNQLADGVVARPKIAAGAVSTDKILDGSVTQDDERHPHLSARINPNGTKLTGDVVQTQRLATGHYRVQLGTEHLATGNLDRCAFTLTPDFHRVNGNGPIAMRRAYPSYAPGSSNIDVFTSEQTPAERNSPPTWASTSWRPAESGASPPERHRALRRRAPSGGCGGPIVTI